MKQTRIFLLLAILIFMAAPSGQGTKSAASASAPQAQQSQPGPTIASAVDREISAVEKQVWKLPRPCRRINSTSLLRA